MELDDDFDLVHSKSEKELEIDSKVLARQIQDLQDFLETQKKRNGCLKQKQNEFT